MDLSHSARHLPGRLAVLVLRDGDKTPVLATIGGGVLAGGAGRGRRSGAGGKGFPEMLRCSVIKLCITTF